MDKFHDSAGVPWEGREFSNNTFANDDGSTPPALAKIFEEDVIDKAELFIALGEVRLLVPLLATLGESEVGPFGQRVDKSADLSVVAVATPDNQSALPAFSSVQQMQLWNPAARPVPINGRRIALAAIGEGHSRVVLDPAGKSIGLRRPLLAALAQSKNWMVPHLNPLVIEIVDQTISESSFVTKAKLIDGDPNSQLIKPELLIELSVKPGLSQESLNSVLAEFTLKIQTQAFLENVDSISYRVISA
jgi:hypothetical protein